MRAKVVIAVPDGVVLEPELVRDRTVAVVSEEKRG
jgi:hypothetical protein